MAHEKRYAGLIRLGSATSTDDASGSVLTRRPVPPLDRDALDQLERKLSGEIDQRPPAFSAVQVGGRRAYAAARAGRPLALEARTVVVHELRLEAAGAEAIAFTLRCGPGTYVRSLARDLGERLGCGAHLESLRRLSVGRFTVDEAFTLEEVAVLAGAGELAAALLPADEALVDMDAALLGPDSSRRFRTGVVVHARRPWRPGTARAYDEDGTFLGIGALDGAGALRPARVLASPQGPGG